jgi:hypothetical protein
LNFEKKISLTVGTIELIENYSQVVFSEPVKSLPGNMRGYLIDWLVGAHHQLKLLSETLFLTVSIFDRFMAVSWLGEKYHF